MNTEQTFLSALLILLFLIPAAAQNGSDDNKESKAVSSGQLEKGEITKLLQEKLKVTKAEKLEFKEIIKNTGGKIAKIWNSLCAYDKVIDAKDTFCISQTDFSSGSGYAFKYGNYLESFASINVVKGEFLALQYGGATQLLVDLGDIDFEKISKDNSKVIGLNSFPLHSVRAGKGLKSLTEGFEFRGLKISDRQRVVLNHTYLLRSAVYRNVENEFTTSVWKREILHSFRVIKQKDNVVTILWKKIQSKWKSANVS